MINSKIADALDMTIPEVEEQSGDMVIVEPHELVKVDNDLLPPMDDIDMSMATAEKQLDVVIQDGMDSLKEQSKETISIEPKYRNRHLEVVSLTRRDVFDAIKQKMEFQLKKRKQRMVEQDYGQGVKTVGTSEKADVFFSGSREDIMAMYMNKMKDNAEDVVVEEV